MFLTDTMYRCRDTCAPWRWCRGPPRPARSLCWRTAGRRDIRLVRTEAHQEHPSLDWAPSAGAGAIWTTSNTRRVTMSLQRNHKNKCIMCVRMHQILYINNISIIWTRKYSQKHQRVYTSYIFRLKEYYLIFFILYCIHLISFSKV